MVLGLLAIERQRQVTAAAGVFTGQRGRQRDALVGGSEQQVELSQFAGALRRVDRIGIAAGQFRHYRAGIEATGVEEIWTVADGLEGELAEAQGLRAQCELQEAGAVV